MTYAIIRTGGKQFRAESGKTIRVPTLPGDAGSKVTFDDVILGSDGDKQKRRKNYAKKQGHRQAFTEVRIKDIAFGKKSGGEK
jgi:large subunit ribosomal protein L21